MKIKSNHLLYILKGTYINEYFSSTFAKIVTILAFADISSPSRPLPLIFIDDRLEEANEYMNHELRTQINRDNFNSLHQIEKCGNGPSALWGRYTS